MNSKIWLLLILATVPFLTQAGWGNRLEEIQKEQERKIKLRQTVLDLVNKTPNLEHLSHDSPLLAIVSYDDCSDLVELMLQNKANPNVTERNTGCTPLHLAALHRNLKAVLILLKAGANPNIKNQIGYETGLHDSIRQGNIEVTRALLSYGANPNDADRNLDTPLIKALGEGVNPLGLMRNRKKMVELLLHYGANPLLENKNKEKALYIVCEQFRRALKDAERFMLVDPGFGQRYLTEANDYKAIARLLLCHAGLYAAQSRIAKQGLSQVLPVDIAKHIASYIPEYITHTPGCITKQEEQPCPICLEEDNKAKAILACNHNNFHVACLEQWREMKASNPTCPLCRQEVVLNDQVWLTYGQYI